MEFRLTGAMRAGCYPGSRTKSRYGARRLGGHGQTAGEHLPGAKP